MRVLSLVLWVVLAFALVGCHGSSIVGKWQGSAKAPAGKENDPSQKMADAFASAVNFEFKSDNTFTGTVLFPVEGTYTVSGNTVTMTVTKLVGMESKDAKMDSKPMKMTLSSDGKTLTSEDVGKGSLVLTKQG